MTLIESLSEVTGKPVVQTIFCNYSRHILAVTCANIVVALNKKCSWLYLLHSCTLASYQLLY